MVIVWQPSARSPEMPRLADQTPTVRVVTGPEGILLYVGRLKWTRQAPGRGHGGHECVKGTSRTERAIRGPGSRATRGVCAGASSVQGLALIHATQPNALGPPQEIIKAVVE